MDRTEDKPRAALFRRRGRFALIAFAGMRDRWRNPETGEDILSATILATDVSLWMRAYHDRMPVILRPEHFERWLAGDMGADEGGGSRGNLEGVAGLDPRQQVRR